MSIDGIKDYEIYKVDGVIIKKKITLMVYI